MTKGLTNEEMRQRVQALVEAEKRIDAAVQRSDYTSWRWASYGKPSSGGPYMWNDIILTHPDGMKKVIEALTFVEEMA